MKKNQIFKPTPLYKEFMILDLISKDVQITQRMMSDNLDVSVSMINEYLHKYEEKGYIKKEFVTPKIIHYKITKKGIERKKLLNIHYLESSLSVYTSAKENIVTFLSQIINKGFKEVLFYGAGEVAEIILHVIHNDSSIPLKVIAIVDDDVKKQGKILVNIPIIKMEDINKYKHDGIMISSYTNNEVIYKKLVAIKYDRAKILSFFEN